MLQAYTTASPARPRFTCHPWHARCEAEHAAGNLTSSFLLVLKVLPLFRSRDGIFPSHARLAARSGVSIRTVARALKAAAALDLLNWHEGPRRRIGWRSLQGSNRYFLRMPEDPVEPRQRRARGKIATACQTDRRSSQSSKKEAQEARVNQLASLLAEARRQPSLLTLRNQAMEAAMRRRYGFE